MAWKEGDRAGWVFTIRVKGSDDLGSAALHAAAEVVSISADHMRQLKGGRPSRRKRPADIDVLVEEVLAEV